MLTATQPVLKDVFHAPVRVLTHVWINVLIHVRVHVWGAKRYVLHVLVCVALHALVGVEIIVI